MYLLADYCSIRTDLLYVANFFAGIQISRISPKSFLQNLFSRMAQPASRSNLRIVDLIIRSVS